MKFLRTSLFLAMSFMVSSLQAATDCSTVTEIPTVECEALLSLYESTNGPGWTDNTGWNSTNTPCSWYGISCQDGHVTEISLYGNQLGGMIPVELSRLSNLHYLNLHRNQLTGTIPAELGQIPNLQYIDLSSNQLNGSIPAELGQHFNLQLLSLSGNKLSGMIPVELGNLSNLQALFLYHNQLNGSIPAELGKLSTLQSLELYSNQLSGMIPVELGNLSSLQSLQLADNQLSGAIPAELGNLSNLKDLDLSNNNLCGDIPTFLKNLSNLDTHFGLNDISNNVLNTTISDPELADFLNTKMVSVYSSWKDQRSPPNICTILSGLPELGEEKLFNYVGDVVFGTEVVFLGGIAINQEKTYYRQSSLSLSESVDIQGMIRIISGVVPVETVDIFIYAETTFPFSPNTFYYGLDERSNIYAWDRNTASLVPFMKNVSTSITTVQIFIPLYQGKFLYPGTLKIFFGYQFSDGNNNLVRVTSSQPIVVEIKE